MYIHPEIENLRGDPAPQQEAQDVLTKCVTQWRETTAKHVVEQLAHYGNGAPLRRCTALANLFVSSESASQANRESEALLLPLVEAVLDILRLHPLGHVPLRHQLSDGIGVLLLEQARAANLALIFHQPHCAIAAPKHVCFADCERHERVMHGSAQALLFERSTDPASSSVPSSRGISLERGTTLELNGLREAKAVVHVHTPLLTLRLVRNAPHAQPSEEIRLSDGAVIHRSAASQAESHAAMAIALLGAMRRKDAVPQIESTAGNLANSKSLRWEAVRHCLALDRLRGFRLLDRLAQDSGDPLTTNVLALRAQLLETYPAFAKLDQNASLRKNDVEALLCPA